MLVDLVAWAARAGPGLYAVVFLLVFGESAVFLDFVIPGEVGLVLSSAAARDAGLWLPMVIAVATLGAVALFDQVLKLVASRLSSPGRGAEAFRFGGEEFTLVFPGKRLSEVVPRLEALRRDIEQYQFLMREGPRDEEQILNKEPSPAVSATRTLVSVSVSIGAAERTDAVIKPADVLKAADNALYKAKGTGRNRVSY